MMVDGYRYVRAALAALAVSAVTASVAVGLAAAPAMAERTLTAQAANGGARAPSLSLAIGPHGRPEVAAIGKHATLLYYTTVRGKWRSTQVAGAGTAQSGPSLVSLAGGNAAIAVAGPKDDLLLFTLHNGHWSRQTIDGPGSALSAPSMALSPYGLAIAVAGPGKTLYFYWFRNGVWNIVQADGGTTYSAPSLVIRNKQQAVTGAPAGQADIVVEGASHVLTFASAQPGYTTWFTENVLTNAVYSTPSQLVTVKDGPDLVPGEAAWAFEGPQHRIELEYFANGHAEIYISKPNSIYSAPSLAQNLADGRRAVDMVYQAAASKVLDLVQFYSGKEPVQRFTSLGSVHADSAPAVAAGAPEASTVDAVVEGAGNTLWYFQGPEPKSSSSLPRFTGVEIGGGGSTFGG
jgi:hypothetical protein